MAYPTVDTVESRKAGMARKAISAPATQRERVRAALMLLGLLSLMAVFWIAVLRLVV